MLQIGDVVRLKSGGPFMTVLSVGEDKGVKTQWFKKYTLYTSSPHVFPEASLKKIDNPEREGL